MSDSLRELYESMTGLMYAERKLEDYVEDMHDNPRPRQMDRHKAAVEEAMNRFASAFKAAVLEVMVAEAKKEATS